MRLAGDGTNPKTIISPLLVAFRPVVRLAEHLAVLDVGSAALALRRHVVGVHFREFPHTGGDIEPAAWREALRLMNEATVDGLSRSDVPPTHEEEFYRELKHSNEVFAAFKVHSMGEKMAAKLTTPDGKLKPFRQWAEDVRGISSHYVGSWLRTEYDTAVLRAHAAADWRRFERDKDIMPNLRWMPTTSPEPESTHRLYWQ